MKAETNIEKLRKLITDEPSGWKAKAEWREANKDWLDKSALIAIRILSKLRDDGISQKELSEMIDVSPQYINKVVKGSENLSLETVCKIEKALGITLLSVPKFETSPVYREIRTATQSVIDRKICISIGAYASKYGKQEDFVTDKQCEYKITV